MDGDARVTSPTGNWFQYRWRVLHEFTISPLWVAGGNLPDPVRPYVFTIGDLGVTRFASTDTWQMTIVAIRDPLFAGYFALYTYWPRHLSTENDHETLTGAKQPTWYYEGALSGMGLAKGYLDGWIESPIYHLPEMIFEGDLIDVAQFYPLSSPSPIMGRGWLLYTRTAMSIAPHRDIVTVPYEGGLYEVRQEEDVTALLAKLSAGRDVLDFGAAVPLDADMDEPLLTPGLLITDANLREVRSQQGEGSDLVVQSAEDLAETWSAPAVEWTGYTYPRTARRPQLGCGVEYLFGLREGALCCKWLDGADWSGKLRSWRVLPHASGVEVLPGNDVSGVLTVSTVASMTAALVGAGMNYVYVVSSGGATFVEVTMVPQTYGVRWLVGRVRAVADGSGGFRATEIDVTVNTARPGLRAEVSDGGPGATVSASVRPGPGRVGTVYGVPAQAAVTLDSAGTWWAYVTRSGQVLSVAASKTPPANASLVAKLAVGGSAGALTLAEGDVDNDYDGVLVDAGVPNQNVGADVDDGAQVRVRYVKNSQEQYRYSMDDGESFLAGTVS